MSDIRTKYRPKTFDEVVGQDPVVKSLKSVLKRKSCRSFLFEGDPGRGKTTLARLVAKSVGCATKNVMEVDAATKNSVDDMREVTASMIFNAIGDTPKKMYIIDEAHRLSPAAWTSLLKSSEEPPPHVYWAFCTTDSAKIPPAIRTRCASYKLAAVGKDMLFDFISGIAKREEFDTPEEVLYLIAEKSDGSPRQALTLLAQCADCETRKSAAEIIKVVHDEQSGEARELCQALYRGANWPELMKILDRITDVNPESVRYLVLNWFTKVAKGAKSVQKAEAALAVLEAFAEPYPSTTQQFPLILSLARLYG